MTIRQQFIFNDNGDDLQLNTIDYPVNICIIKLSHVHNAIDSKIPSSKQHLLNKYVSLWNIVREISNNTMSLFNNVLLCIILHIQSYFMCECLTISLNVS